MRPGVDGGIAPEEARGGNSAFTGGAFRVVYHGGDDLTCLIPDMNETELRSVDFGTYTEEQYFDDMGRLTQYRCDPDMTETLIHRSFETGVWVRGKGVRFQLGLGRQAFRIGLLQGDSASRACACVIRVASRPTTGHPIPGLYAAGEIVGGLFYHNYASGTGLMSGAVFGRIAGRSATAFTAILEAKK
jgi:succinate dehydrogenase/fumarate reductase flavoprotein subunit